MKKTKAMIIGSGNIGTDLMHKICSTSSVLELVAMVGIDPESKGLEMAKAAGIATTHQGIKGAEKLAVWNDIQIAFDATSAGAHKQHDQVCRAAGKQIIDLTPAAIGPYCVPVVNMTEHLNAANVNMVSCGGQATIPMVHAIKRAAQSVPYAEIVASVASQSAGPGTRANIDEFTQTTAAGIERVGGAENGKAIIILNPAEPPMLMRNTIYTLSIGSDQRDIVKSVDEMVAQVQLYVPGYRLKQALQFEQIGADKKLDIPGYGKASGLKTTVFIEVEGAGHFLSKYAGNLDIMTSAALATGESIAKLKFEEAA